MRILCDHHVAPKYVRALEREPWITVTTVESALERDASDATISSFATANDWILLTNDDDFYRLGADHGLCVYSQLADPSPGEVVDALREIEAAYAAHDEITEVVPGEWIGP